MSDPRTYLDAVLARAEAATPGPWEADSVNGPPAVFTMHEDGIGGTVAECGDAYPRGVNRPAESMEFIAHARTDAPRMAEALRAVLDLHQPNEYAYPDGTAPCEECNRSDQEGLHPTWWPCPTVQAITETLGDEA